ncbi:Myb/SANT-like domain [Sesbania bispinosa]|nr:Myb/SANT-like domain [Sesbania bispinosa]
MSDHPDARSFRARVLENYDQFCIIFGHFNDPLHETVPFDELVEVASICPVNYDNHVKDQGKQMRWTSDMDSCLSAILVQQIKLGNRSKFDYKLKPAAFEAAVLAINEKFQLDLMKEHINPEARLLKGRVIRNYDELCIIIGHGNPPDSSMNGARANVGMTADYDVMEGQETNHHRINNTMEKGVHVTWTDEMDHCLTELLVNQVMLGNKLEKNFKTSAHIAALTVLNERFGLNLTKEKIINRLKAWRKQYGLVKEMLSQGGFEWDEGRKMVVAPDSKWNEYIKKHPDARHLKDRRIENYNELGIIVGNEQTSGNWSENFERVDVNLAPNFEEHAETPALVMLANEEMSHDNASDKAQGSFEQTRARPSSSHSQQPLKRRRTGDVMLQMMSVMAADIGRIADALTESNKTVCLEELWLKRCRVFLTLMMISSLKLVNIYVLMRRGR